MQQVKRHDSDDGESNVVSKSTVILVLATVSPDLSFLVSTLEYFTSDSPVNGFSTT